MKPRKVPSSNHVFELPGGNEDNYLHARVGIGHPAVIDADGQPTIEAVFEPTPEERAMLAVGGNVALIIWGKTVPPMVMTTTREQPVGRLNRANRETPEDVPAAWTELPLPAVEDLIEVIDYYREANERLQLPGIERVERLRVFRDGLEALLPELHRLAAEAGQEPEA